MATIDLQTNGQESRKLMCASGRASNILSESAVEAC
jgi:hypothetical protein